MTDQRIGQEVLRYTLVIRRQRKLPETLPLTGGWVQQVSRKLGCPVGEHRALRIIRQLRAEGALAAVGSYRQPYSGTLPSGWRVTLYRLAGQVPGAKSKASIRRRGSRKPWWQHPLFGFEGDYPGVLPLRLRRWREPFGA